MQNRKFRRNMSSFDLAKGLAMICIVLGHSLSSGRYSMDDLSLLTPFLKILSLGTYLLPMFFIISGYGFKEKAPGKILKKTFSDLIIPYLWVMLAVILIYPVMYYIHSGSISEAVTVAIRYFFAYLLGIPEYGKVFLGYDVLSIFAMWFFLTLFVALNVLNLILKVKHPEGQFLGVCLCFFAGYRLLILECNYYCIPQGLLAVGYCYIGYIFKKNNLLIRGLNCIWIYLGFIAVTVAAFRWGQFDMCLGIFNYGILDCIVAGLVGIGLVFSFVYLGQFDWKATDWIKKIGVYTYWIICIHTVEFYLAQWMDLFSVMPNSYLALAVELLLKTVLIASGCCLLKKLAHYKYQKRAEKRKGEFSKNYKC